MDALTRRFSSDSMKVQTRGQTDGKLHLLQDYPPGIARQDRP